MVIDQITLTTCGNYRRSPKRLPLVDIPLTHPTGQGKDPGRITMRIRSNTNRFNGSAGRPDKGTRLGMKVKNGHIGRAKSLAREDP